MVALNLQTNDLPVHLHDALFHGSGGYVLKPAALRAPDRAIQPPTPTNRGPVTPARGGSGDDRVLREGAGRGKPWPPPREEVHRTELKAPLRLAAAPFSSPSRQLTERPTAA